MPTLSNVTSPYFTLKRSVPPHPAPHDSSSWARENCETAPGGEGRRFCGDYYSGHLQPKNRQHLQMFCRLSVFFSDYLQMFFRCSSDFFQIFFKLSSDYLEIIFGKRNMQGGALQFQVVLQYVVL